MLKFLNQLFYRNKKKQVCFFDDNFGFILKYRIDTEENYNRVKSHFFQYHQASE